MERYFLPEDIIETYENYESPENEEDLNKSRSMKWLTPVYRELGERIRLTLETYSNVHRGTGHFSTVTTALYEQARIVCLAYLNLDPRTHHLIFCTPHGADLLRQQFRNKDIRQLSSADYGLPFGLCAIAIRKRDLRRRKPSQTGGSVTKMVSPNFIIWADAPGRFEPGTPCIVNAIAFACSLDLMKKYGSDCFRHYREDCSAQEILYRDNLKESGHRLYLQLNKLLVGKDFRVPTVQGDVAYVNADNAASTPTYYPVLHAALRSLSQHDEVQQEIRREVRKILAAFTGASLATHEIFFTGNTTEAINFTARLIGAEYSNGPEFAILNTLLEHNSNELPWRYIPGATVVRVPVDKEGYIDLYRLELLLRKYNLESRYGKKRIRLVAVSGASNVLGTLNNIKAISRIAHKYQARILVDAAQLVAHGPIRMDEWAIDYLAFSGHKVYAPFGSGALIVKKEHLNGDLPEQVNFKASGDENTMGIAALGKSVSLLQRIGLEVIEQEERSLLNHLQTGLTGIPGIEVYSAMVDVTKKPCIRSPIVSFRLKNMDHRLTARYLAERGGIGVRFGCFCTHLLVKHLLGLPKALTYIQNAILLLAPGISHFIPGLMRVSLGLENRRAEVDRLIAVLKETAEIPRSGRTQPNRSEEINKVRTQIKQFMESRIGMVYGIVPDIK